MTPKYDTIIQQFLRQELINLPYLYIDLWSLVHLSSGLILGVLLKKLYQKKYSWLIVLLLLVGYEIVEVFLTGILFVSETPADTVWDIIIGMTGFFIAYRFTPKK